MDSPSEDLLRLFVGLRVGAACRPPLARALARLARDDDALRPTREEDLHLTLQFLGATRPELVEPLGAALAEVARRHAPIDVRYVGLGAFPAQLLGGGPRSPSAGPARVLWVGMLEERPGALAALARDVGQALSSLGFRPEERAFKAHVTLARVRDRSRVAAGTLERLRAGAETDFGADRLSDLKLMLSPSGGSRYTYKDLTSLPLSLAG